MTTRNGIVRALDRLEQQLGGQRSVEDLVDEEQQQRRWEETARRFEELLPEDLFDRVNEALADERHPLWEWFDSVFRGRSRLPECLTEEVMRRLVEARLYQADGDFIDAVCLRCGAQYPLLNFTSSVDCKCADCQSRKQRRAETVALFERLFDHEG